MVKQLKGYEPLCLINNRLVLYKKGKLILYDESFDSYKIVVNLKSNIMKEIRESFRFSSRLFHTGIRTALPISEDEVIFTYDKCLQYAAISKNQVMELFQIKNGFSAPLNLCVPNRGTELVALFGDYGNNANREEVSIYGVHKDLSVKKIYTFPPGKIRHIHNIIHDELRRGYYIFIGDNEADAGIYWTDDYFSKMEPILLGSQKARAVCGFVTAKGLLYATDSISQQNYIYMLNLHNGEPSLQIVTAINGSCIYGTKYSSGYFFSTTVEPEESNKNKIFGLLSMKRGQGILSEDVHLVYVSPQLETKVVAAYRKDRLPYKLFQYGSIRFPSGLENSDTLIMYPCAVNKLDGNTVFMTDI